ncbi:MAG: hypothetical protein HC831_16510 [Chloroflexia bacterium]|nr:hypothetical protein [Chloroflexia bacterium]
MINEIRPYPGSYGFLLSNNGVFTAVPNDKMVNETIEKIMPEENLEQNIIINIKEGNRFSYIKTDSLDQSFYISYHPLKFGNAPAYWSLGVAVPYEIC